MSEPTDDPRPKLRLLGDTITRPFATKDGGDGWPVLAGEVRPAMPREVSAYAKRRAEAKTGDADDLARAEFYARHVKAWDAEGDGGGPLPVTAAAMLALPYPLWLQLEDIVLGFRGPEVVGKSAGSPES